MVGRFLEPFNRLPELLVGGRQTGRKGLVLPGQCTQGLLDASADVLQHGQQRISAAPVDLGGRLSDHSVRTVQKMMDGWNRI